jgi:hypothetical protein
VIEIEKLRSSKALRTAVLALCLATISFTGLSALYIRFHYAEVMPRSPQPETGRIYPMPAQYGGTVYVSRAELDRSDFVKYPRPLCAPFRKKQLVVTVAWRRNLSPIVC